MTTAVASKLPLIESPAMEHLLEYSRQRHGGETYGAMYRMGSDAVVTDGVLLLRLRGVDPVALETLDVAPFADDAIKGDKLRAPLKLFHVDDNTLHAWAGEERLAMVECSSCGGFGVTDPPEHDDDVEICLCESCAPGGSFPCDCCDDGKVPAPARYGWLTPRRLVDRRYVAELLEMARLGEIIDVMGSDDPLGALRFVGKGWDAFLMPCRTENVFGEDIEPPLWRKPPTLEGNAE